MTRYDRSSADRNIAIGTAGSRRGVTVALLLLERPARPRHGPQPLERDWGAAVLAHSVGPRLDPGERALDLGEQLGVERGEPKALGLVDHPLRHVAVLERVVGDAPSLSAPSIDRGSEHLALALERPPQILELAFRQMGHGIRCSTSRAAAARRSTAP